MTIANPDFPVRFAIDPGATHLAFYADAPEPHTIARVNADGSHVVFDWPGIEAAARDGAHLAVMLVAARDAGKREAIETEANRLEHRSGLPTTKPDAAHALMLAAADMRTRLPVAP